jgi:hypothetical protein
MAQKHTLTAHCYIISFDVCSELLPEDGRQGPKHVGDFLYIRNVLECIRWKLLFITVRNITWEYAVAQFVRHCATSRKVAGSITGGATVIFQ